VLTDIAETLMESQQVRNVWAHNGGRADSKLLEQAPGLGYDIGDEVKATKPMLGKYLVALNTYKTIIVNPDRVANGFAPLVCYGGEKNVFKASFDELFPGAILPVKLRDMSRSASDDLPDKLFRALQQTEFEMHVLIKFKLFVVESAHQHVLQRRR
jgi:hypothetical protein